MPLSSMTHRRFAAVLAALAVLASGATARAAETAAPPSHLAAYNLAWLDYLDPADVPAKRAAVCLIDSGVRVTPDTPDDSPAGPIIARLAVDGGPGTPEGETFEHLHGTRMAMAMAAPQNGWGTIGAWSGAPIVAVRGTTAGESTFRGEYYAKGIKTCLQYQADSGMSVAAISLSLGCSSCPFSAEELSVLEDRIAGAHNNGVSIIAAAGNDQGSVQLPADTPGVLAVAAGDHSGALCPYGSFGTQVAVIGPGCPVEAADVLSGQPGLANGGGSSVATAVTSTLLAALRTLRPDASWDQVESWVRHSARVVEGRRVLDGRAAAVAASLGPVVARAEARQVRTVTPALWSTPTTESSGTSGDVTIHIHRAQKLPTPKVVLARRRGHRLTVAVSNRPKRAQVMLTIERLDRAGLGVRSRKRLTRSSSRVFTRTPWRPSRLRLRFLPAASGKDARRMSREQVLRRHNNRYR